MNALKCTVIFLSLLVSCNKRASQSDFTPEECLKYRNSTIGLDMLDLHITYKELNFLKYIPNALEVSKGIYISQDFVDIADSNKEAGLFINEQMNKHQLDLEDLYKHVTQMYPDFKRSISEQEYINNARSFSINESNTEKYLEYLSYKYNNKDILCKSSETFKNNDVFIFTLRDFRKVVKQYGREEYVYKFDRGFVSKTKTNHKYIIKIYSYVSDDESEVILYAPLDAKINLFDHIYIERNLGEP